MPRPLGISIVCWCGARLLPTNKHQWLYLTKAEKPPNIAPSPLLASTRYSQSTPYRTRVVEPRTRIGGCRDITDFLGLQLSTHDVKVEGRLPCGAEEVLASQGEEVEERMIFRGTRELLLGTYCRVMLLHL